MGGAWSRLREEGRAKHRVGLKCSGCGQTVLHLVRLVKPLGHDHKEERTNECKSQHDQHDQHQYRKERSVSRCCFGRSDGFVHAYSDALPTGSGGSTYPTPSKQQPIRASRRSFQGVRQNVFTVILH